VESASIKTAKLRAKSAAAMSVMPPKVCVSLIGSFQPPDREANVASAAISSIARELALG
jgi:hypothetical protein